MTSAPLQPRSVAEVDDVIVEPAAVAWHRRLATDLPPGSPTELIADRVVQLVADELTADHVALWHLDGDDYAVLGAAGFSAGARRMRLPVDYPVVNVCRGTGGRLLRGPETHVGPRAPGLPGSSSNAYAMVMLDDAGPVSLLTMSGPRLGTDEVDAVCDLVARLLTHRPQGH